MLLSSDLPVAPREHRFCSRVPVWRWWRCGESGCRVVVIRLDQRLSAREYPSHIATCALNGATAETGSVRHGPKFAPMYSLLESRRFSVDFARVALSMAAIGLGSAASVRIFAAQSTVPSRTQAGVRAALAAFDSRVLMLRRMQ